MSNVLSALMPDLRQKVLTTLLLHPETSWSLTDLAAAIGTKPANIYREVNSLSDVGIILPRRDGKRTLYQANTQTPTYPALRDLFEKTVGAIAVLQKLLTPNLSPGDIAFVFGSFARGDETSASDIDLMIVGDTSLFDLSPVLREAETATRRIINPVTYTPDEFRQKWCDQNHFVRTVMPSPKRFLKGSKDDLARLIECESGSHTSNE